LRSPAFYTSKYDFKKLTFLGSHLSSAVITSTLRLPFSPGNSKRTINPGFLAATFHTTNIGFINGIDAFINGSINCKNKQFNRTSRPQTQNTTFHHCSSMPKTIDRTKNPLPSLPDFVSRFCKSTILHNLHNFRTILLNRQWAALFESKQIQAQKDVFQFLCTNAKTNCAPKKSPTQNRQNMVLNILVNGGLWLHNC
jgi:hypothetical protein